MVIQKNKKGWMRIVEAFVAVLLITGVLLVIINKGYLKESISAEVYETELLILRGIQLNDTLRYNILISNQSGYPGYGPDALPIEWGEFDNSEQRRLAEVKTKIEDQIPKNLKCEAKICELDDDCLFSGPSEKEIYAQPITITAVYGVFMPRQLKLFCWLK